MSSALHRIQNVQLVASRIGGPMRGRRVASWLVRHDIDDNEDNDVNEKCSMFNYVLQLERL